MRETKSSAMKMPLLVLLCLSGCSHKLPPVSQAMAIPDRDSPEARKRAIEKLAETENPEAVVRLLSTARFDKDKSVRESAIQAILEIKKPYALRPLVAALGDRQPYIQGVAAKALGNLPDPAAVPGLIPLLSTPTSDEEMDAILNRRRTPHGTVTFELTIDPDLQTREWDDSDLHADMRFNPHDCAVTSLESICAIDSSPLISALQQTKGDARGDIVDVLCDYGDKRAIPALRKLINVSSTDEAVRNQARVAIMFLEEDEAAVIETLNSQDKEDEALHHPMSRALMMASIDKKPWITQNVIPSVKQKIEEAEKTGNFMAALVWKPIVWSLEGKDNNQQTPTAKPATPDAASDPADTATPAADAPSEGTIKLLKAEWIRSYNFSNDLLIGPTNLPSQILIPEGRRGLMIRMEILVPKISLNETPYSFSASDAVIFSGVSAAC